jgi:hypothetical protein
MLSYNDQQRAAYDALAMRYGSDDAYCDLWVCDMGTDWIVFQSYIDNPGKGTFRIGYSLDDDAVTLGDHPERVRQITTYVPMPTPTSRATILRIRRANRSAAPSA